MNGWSCLQGPHFSYMGTQSSPLTLPNYILGTIPDSHTWAFTSSCAGLNQLPNQALEVILEQCRAKHLCDWIKYIYSSLILNCNFGCILCIPILPYLNSEHELFQNRQLLHIVNIPYQLAISDRKFSFFFINSFLLNIIKNEQWFLTCSKFKAILQVLQKFSKTSRVPV